MKKLLSVVLIIALLVPSVVFASAYRENAIHFSMRYQKLIDRMENNGVVLYNGDVEGFHQIVNMKVLDITKGQIEIEPSNLEIIAVSIDFSFNEDGKMPNAYNVAAMMTALDTLETEEIPQNYSYKYENDPFKEPYEKYYNNIFVENNIALETVRTRHIPLEIYQGENYRMFVFFVQEYNGVDIFRAIILHNDTLKSQSKLYTKAIDTL